MGTSWSDALRRVATTLGRRHRMADGEDSELTDESGFTLIELMVVLLIMGILMAIAIPTFLGVTSTANDTSTQSNLTNAIISAKAIYARSQGYPTTSTKMAKQLKAAEPEFTYVKGTTVSTKQSQISVDVVNATKLVLAAYMTKTKECWVAENTNAAGTSAGVKYGYVTPGATKKTVATTACKAATFANVKNFTVKWPAAPTGH